MLCDDLDGCNGVVVGGKSNGEGIYMSIELTPSSTAELTQYCKAIILQLKSRQGANLYLKSKRRCILTSASCHSYDDNHLPELLIQTEKSNRNSVLQPLIL